MRLALESDSSVLTVRSYAPGDILIGDRHVHAPCIVSAASLVVDWAATSVRELTGAQVESLLQFAPKIILLGTDEPERLAPAAIRRRLAEQGIALESMNLGAACRTYNVLAQEHRVVVAGLFPGR